MCLGSGRELKLAAFNLEQQIVVLAQFLRFGTVGAAGFLVDTATVYATRGALGLYGAGAIAYLTAATANWLFNRLWTFRGQGSGPFDPHKVVFTGAGPASQD